MKMDKEEIRRLKQKAVDVRQDILTMIPKGKTGHLGGSSSIADVAVALYFHQMRLSDDPKDPRRDRCVFSKGHAALAQYACLAEHGYFCKDELCRVKCLGSMLQGHPDMDKTPGIEAVTGSLGQGLSVSLGMALGLRLAQSDSRVYCIVGDRELDEGQIWEAVMAAPAFSVDNLCAIVDLNGVQATDTVANVLRNGNQKAKWEAFGWQALEIDGHDFPQILAALDTAQNTKGKPTVIIAKTVKGKGFAFAEGKAQYHNASLSDEERALAEDAIAAMRRGIDA